jgi:hypothetical protein
LDRFQSCHDFILVEYNCLFGLVGLSLHVTECLFNIKCDEHQTKMTCLFCRTCDHLVCPDCISSKHNKHNFECVGLKFIMDFFTFITQNCITLNAPPF